MKIKIWAKYISIIALRYMLNLFHIFPIKKDRILFYSFNGKQYSCNPRYITEYLLNNFSNQFEIIWAFKDPDKFAYCVPEGIRIVRYRSIKYYFLAKTSRVIIFNVQGYGELARRQKQIFIQTWHASNGYKRVGSYFTGIRRKLNLLGHRDYSFVLCGCKNMEQKRIRGSMNFYGPIIQGTPRMDVLINRDHPELYEKVYSSLNISANKQILLYAPTWRENREQNDYGMDYEALYQAVQKRFGGEWIIAVRLHPNIHSRIDSKVEYLVDASDYPDMQELLYVADILISDYSSCIWDYSFTYRPCFLFCNDLQTYNVERSFDLPIRTWGFPLSISMEELMKEIEDYDEIDFKEKMVQHHEQMGAWEDGKATKRICELICSL